MGIEPVFKCKFNRVRHTMNPLHIYSRLIDAGLQREKARYIASKYETPYRWIDNYVLKPIEKGFYPDI